MAKCTPFKRRPQWAGRAGGVAQADDRGVVASEDLSIFLFNILLFFFSLLLLFFKNFFLKFFIF